MAERNLIFQVEVDTQDSVKSVASLKNEIKVLTKEISTVDVSSSAFSELSNKLAGTKAELKNVGVAAGSIGAIRNEIKQINSELAKTKIDSPEYNSLIQKLGLARAELQDFKTEVKALDPDAKFKAFIGLGQNIAGGFNIASASLSLFGEENENVSEAIQKSVAALSILQGLQSLVDSKDNIAIVKRVLGWKQTSAAIGEATVATEGQAVATSTASNAMGKFNTVLKASGIGLLVVLLGSLIANFESVKKKVLELFPGLSGLGNIFNNIKSSVSGAFEVVKTFFTKTGAAVGAILSGEFSKLGSIFSNLGSDLGGAFQQGFTEKQNEIAKEASDKQLQTLIESEKRKLAVLQASGADTFNLQSTIINQELQLLEKGSKEQLDKLNELEVLKAERKKENADKAIKNAEANAKAEADAERKAKQAAENAVKEDAEVKSTFAANNKREYDEDLENLKSYITQKEIELLKNSKTQEELDKGKSALYKEELNLRLGIEKDYNESSLQTLKEIEEEKFKVQQETRDKNIEATEEQTQKELEIKQQASEQEKQLADEIQQEIFQLSDALVDRVGQNKLDKISANAAKENQILKSQLASGAIDQETYAKKKQLLDERVEKEKRKQLRESAKLHKIIAVTEIAINTLVAILKNTATLGYIPAIPVNILTGILGAVSAGLVLSKPLPAAKKGVYNSKQKANTGAFLHDAEGGETDDQQMYLLSRNEVVINARSAKRFLPELSYINEWGGGVSFTNYKSNGIKFAQGGINTSGAIAANVSTNNNSNTFINDNTNVEKLLQTLINTKYKAYVISTDITSQQQKDNRIEEAARF